MNLQIRLFKGVSCRFFFSQYNKILFQIRMGLEEDLKSQVERINIFIKDYYFVLLLLLCPIHNDSMEACVIKRNL